MRDHAENVDLWPRQLVGEINRYAGGLLARLPIPQSRHQPANGQRRGRVEKGLEGFARDVGFAARVVVDVVPGQLLVQGDISRRGGSLDLKSINQVLAPKLA
ncbi:hypothetical protein D3C77_404130 [compost metagenome]